MASFSSKGPVPEPWAMKSEILAPGYVDEDIWGTSFATPYVRGNCSGRECD